MSRILHRVGFLRQDRFCRSLWRTLLFAGEFPEQANGIGLSVVSLAVLDCDVGVRPPVFIMPMTNALAINVIAVQRLYRDSQAIVNARTVHGIGVHLICADNLKDDKVVIEGSVLDDLSFGKCRLWGRHRVATADKGRQGQKDKQPIISSFFLY